MRFEFDPRKDRANQKKHGLAVVRVISLRRATKAEWKHYVAQIQK